jgi:hypothetical protein
MKNAMHILTHLRHQPRFKKLAHYDCINKVQKLFPPHLQRLVRYGYIRNNILYFVLSHPGGKQEFDSIIGSIKTPLKLHPPLECRETAFNDIRAFVSYKASFKPAAKNPTVYRYHERSEGSFANRARDEKLRSIIESIRAIIHDQSD